MLWGPMVGFVVFAQIAKLVFTEGSRSSSALVRFSGLHNMSLAIFSGTMTIVGVRNLMAREHHSMHGWLCVAPSPAPRLILFWYCSKFYEWVDTALLLARGKELSSLHYNHHMTAATVVASHMVGRSSRVGDRTSIYDVPLLLNAFVHTLMYAYYWSPTAFRPIRQWITRLQIVQHAVVLLSILYTSYKAVGTEDCHVTLLGNGLSLLLYGMYLVQFVAFYARSYQHKQDASRTKEPHHFHSTSKQSTRTKAD